VTGAADLIETLRWLVDTRSPIGEETELCTAIAERLEPTGHDLHRLGNSLIAGRRTGRPLITLYGHIDTVPEQGQGPAYVENGRMFGLGTSDMKAGVAVMLHLLEDRSVVDGPYDVVGVFYDREEGPADENGLIEVLDRVGWLTEAEFAVVLEPTDLQLELGCQGVINATVAFTGRAAHSARPWAGENAITKAGAWLADLDDRPPAPAVVAGLEYREVFTVTSANGGLARNIVPARFEVNLNHRFPPSLSLEQAEERLRAVAQPADEIAIVDRAPAAPVPEGDPHLDRLVEISGAVRAPKQAWTDVARLTQLGVPAINYGPGETAQAHQADESVEVGNVPVAFDVLRRFLT
jgi:succinyl-diaminopimelate desuccinylase